MTAAILKVIEPSELRAFHSIYSALHGARLLAPHLFTAAHCAGIVAALMSCKPWVWRVVGITPAALQKYREANFKYEPRQGITRAHLRPRVASVVELLDTAKPLEPEEFIVALLASDQTVICAKGENTATVTDYIPFENEDGALFSSRRIGFTYKAREVELLRRLSAEPAHNLVQPSVAILPPVEPEAIEG